MLQIGANDDPQFADTVLTCIRAWANPFGPACSTALATQWPARVAAMAPKVEASVNDVRTVMRQAGYPDLLHSADPSHIVQQSFHPNATGHGQLGGCLTEFYGDGLAEGSCLRGADGSLHAVAGVSAPTVRAAAVS